MTKYRVTFNNPMLEEKWYVVSDDLVKNINNQVGTAGYAQYVVYLFEDLTEERYLMFNPANYASVEIKNLGKIEELDDENN